MKRILMILLAAISLSIGLAGCNDSNRSDASINKKELVIGTTPTPFSQQFFDGIKPILEQQGYQIKQIDFSDIIRSNDALSSGTIDFNVDQHTAYLRAYNESRSTALEPVVHIPTLSAAIYSQKHTALSEIQKGAIVVIPNDPANTSRALRLLEKAGWVKLKDNIDPSKASQNDIENNILQINITEMQSGVIPRAMSDFDYAVIPGGRAYSGKVDSKLSLLHEDILPDLEMVVAVLQKNVDSKWASDIKKAYQSDAFKSYINKHNQDNFWFVPKDLFTQ